MNTDMQTPVIKPRKPKTASLLSDLSIGLGHVYSGHLAKGLLLHTSGVAVLVAWIAMIALMKGHFGRAVLLGLFPAVALWLYAKFDARRLAAKAPADYVLADYNRWYIYAELIVVPLLVAACGAFFARATAYEAFRVTADRMAPTIGQGDRVMVNKGIYDVEPTRRGDVVIIRSVNQRNVKLVQRLVALPGDTVRIEGGDVVVSGVRIPRLSPVPTTNPTTRPAAVIETVVPKGHGYFVNDNLTPSQGFPNVGAAPLAYVVGKVEFVYWPRPAWVQ
jgi:signal peptidase I